MHPEVLAWIGDIRNTTGVRRIKATADLYELLRQWEVRKGQRGLVAMRAGLGDGGARLVVQIQGLCSVAIHDLCAPFARVPTVHTCIRRRGDAAPQAGGRARCAAVSALLVARAASADVWHAAAVA